MPNKWKKKRAERVEMIANDGAHIRREEAARILGISVSTLRAWEKSPQYRIPAQIIERAAWHDRAKISELARRLGRQVSDPHASISLALAEGHAPDRIVVEQGASYLEIAQLLGVRDALAARASVKRAWMLQLARALQAEHPDPPPDPSGVDAWCERMLARAWGLAWGAAASAALERDREKEPPPEA